MNIETLQQAIELIKSGNEVEGSKLLKELVGREPDNELAWMWLSTCSANNKTKIVCLENVLRINPVNRKASVALEKLKAIGEEPPLDAILSEKPVSISGQAASKEVVLKKTLPGSVSLNSPLVIGGITAIIVVEGVRSFV